MGFPSIGLSIFAFLLAAYIYQKFQPPPKPNMVGIDLGTTFSSIGTYHSVSGNVTIYEIEAEQKSIPSHVYFSSDGEIFAGYQAQIEAQKEPLNLVYDSKRFIGKSFTSQEIEHLTQLYPFDLYNYHDGTTFFKIHTENFGGAHAISKLMNKLTAFCSPAKHKNQAATNNQESLNPYYIDQTKTEHFIFISPECIGSILISKMLKKAEKVIQRKIIRGVIAVPADFDLRQEKATYQAAKLAGIHIQRIISEPTAAALSYGLHTKEDLNNVVVIDIGGGTTDISLLMLQGGMFFVRALAGNNRLGGQDFNARLLEHVITILKEEHGQSVEFSRHEDLQRLKQLIETAKLELCTSPHQTYELKINFHLSYPHDHNDTIQSPQKHAIKEVQFKTTLSRQIFGEVNKPTIDKIIETLEDCLVNGGILGPLKQVLNADPYNYVQEVVLVGGSVKVPLVHETIRKYFANYSQQVSNFVKHDDAQNEKNSSKFAPTNVQLSDDPELAVAKGVAIMAGIMGGAWPLTVSAIEPYPRRRTHKYNKAPPQ